MAKLTGKIYGDALFELAVSAGRADELLAEVRSVSQILAENGGFSGLMEHPGIKKEEKLAILEEVFKGRIRDELLGLMLQLVRKDHYRETAAVFSCFVDQVKEYKKIGTAYVTSAISLREAQKKRILQKLLATTKYGSFEMRYSVDKELIGGLVVRIGDRVVDSSIRTRLAKLSWELSKIQLKVGEYAP